MIGDPIEGTNGKFSEGLRGVAADDNFYFNPNAFAQVPAGANRFGNMPRNAIYGPGDQQWDIAIFKNVNARGDPQDADPRGDLQLHQSPEPERSEHGHHQRQLRPHHHEVGDRRDIQLALRYTF